MSDEWTRDEYSTRRAPVRPLCTGVGQGCNEERVKWRKMEFGEETKKKGITDKDNM